MCEILIRGGAEVGLASNKSCWYTLPHAGLVNGDLDQLPEIFADESQ